MLLITTILILYDILCDIYSIDITNLLFFCFLLDVLEQLLDVLGHMLDVLGHMLDVLEQLFYLFENIFIVAYSFIYYGLF